jgi:hypothetical protein
MSMTVLQLRHQYQAQAGLVLGQWLRSESVLHMRQVIARRFTFRNS